jgi:hypothetical protein
VLTLSLLGSVSGEARVGVAGVASGGHLVLTERTWSRIGY